MDLSRLSKAGQVPPPKPAAPGDTNPAVIGALAVLISLAGVLFVLSRQP